MLLGLDWMSWWGEKNNEKHDNNVYNSLKKERGVQEEREIGMVSLELPE